MWNFFKKFKKEEPKIPAWPVKESPVRPAPAPVPAAAPAPDAAVAVQPVPQPVAAPRPEKPNAEKTDDELAEELNKISPEILSQAKNPQMRKTIIDIYRKMLIEGVNVKDEKEVKKWLKKHPEVVNGGEVQKIETMKRAEPKVGRNEPCPCGSRRKYKKCCGADGGRK